MGSLCYSGNFHLRFVHNHNLVIENGFTKNRYQHISTKQKDVIALKFCAFYLVVENVFTFSTKQWDIIALKCSSRPFTRPSSRWHGGWYFHHVMILLLVTHGLKILGRHEVLWVMKTLATKFQSLPILIKKMVKPLFALTISGVMNEIHGKFEIR